MGGRALLAPTDTGKPRRSHQPHAAARQPQKGRCGDFAEETLSVSRKRLPAPPKGEPFGSCGMSGRALLAPTDTGKPRRSHQPHAAARQPQRGRCGDFAEERFRFCGNSGVPPQPSRPGVQPLTQARKEQAGVRGDARFRLNIHLPLSPLANSPLGRRGTRMPRRLCARGSMTLRRAKAALQVRIGSA